jgi:hypothetical protein
MLPPVDPDLPLYIVPVPIFPYCVDLVTPKFLRLFPPL